MIRRRLLLGARLFALIFACLIVGDAEAQRRLDARGGIESFLDTQWWLGLKFGTNVTQPFANETYMVTSQINAASEEEAAKQYDDFNLIGVQIGLDATYYARGLSFGIQPMYKRIRYSYANRFSWDSSIQPEAFITDYDVEQALDLVVVPITLKYDIIKRGNLRPFVIAGVSYSFIMGANKQLDIRHTDVVLDSRVVGGEVSLNVPNEFQGFLSAFGGIGASYDVGNIRLYLDFAYNYGITSAVNKEEIFEENAFFAVGEINDDIFIRNISGSFGVVFPLKFIDNTFQSSR
ncbi:MAG: outer membrane beta-barrel protein [Bacteroidota bacterium]